MRHLTAYLLGAFLSTAVTVACTENSTLPLDPGAPSLATRTGHDNVRVEFVLDDVDNPCTPAVDAIDFEGIIHGQGSQWDNDHFKSHYNVNFKGIDANGVPYQGTSTGNGNLGSDTEDMVISTVISSRGGLPNFISKIVLHHHKDGTVTVDRAGEACRG